MTTPNPFDDYIKQLVAEAIKPYLTRLTQLENTVHTPPKSPKSPKMPARHGEPWTRTEERSITEYIRLIIEETAREHKRSTKAMAFKIKQIADDYI